ncbi:DUF6516 family protein [candidate division WOR-3 bacterium]|nr:DUF6516 family protein [candidate division WOR-3 bacterium]
MIKRWDCAKHYPHLNNFPYHVHIRSEDSVEPTGKLDLQAILALITREGPNCRMKTRPSISA